MPIGYSYNPPVYGQQSYAPQPQMAQPQQPIVVEPIKWVDGEVGALAFQMPANMPVNQPIALWDSQSQRIYLKSWNQIGMANKIQKLEYVILNDEPAPSLPQGSQSGSMSGDYVSKSEFNELRDEIRNLSGMIQRQQGRENNRSGQNGSNRGEGNVKSAV